MSGLVWPTFPEAPGWPILSAPWIHVFLFFFFQFHRKLILFYCFGRAARKLNLHGSTSNFVAPDDGANLPTGNALPSMCIFGAITACSENPTCDDDLFFLFFCIQFSQPTTISAVSAHMCFDCAWLKTRFPWGTSYSNRLTVFRRKRYFIWFIGFIDIFIFSNGHEFTIRWYWWWPLAVSECESWTCITDDIWSETIWQTTYARCSPTPPW